MNNKAYESGYLEGKSEGFEQGASYGANRMFETIFTAYQENGLSLKKLKKIQKEYKVTSFKKPHLNFRNHILMCNLYLQ